MNKILIGLALFSALVFESCNNNAGKKTEQQPVPVAAPAPAPVAISADSVISKFKTTPYRLTKLNQGASKYIDTTFNNQPFLVKDTISDIRVDNGGKGFFILGKLQGTENLKCYFADAKDQDSIKVNQVITLTSDKHAAVVQKLTFPGSDTVINVYAVELGNCKWVK